MPALRQPKLLIMMCESAAGTLMINLVNSCTQPNQLIILEEYVQVLPPVLYQNVMNSVLRHLGTDYSSYASAEVITSLFKILLHPRMSDLKLSDLTGVGEVPLDSLDVLEVSLKEHLPSMSQLTHVDFSTHRYKITYPSICDDMLHIMSNCCPNLRVLNLNFNNRVTSRGIRYLVPSKTNERKGCVKLEKLFVLDCSVDVHDVCFVLAKLPNLTIVGFREVGSSLMLLEEQEDYNDNDDPLKLTHLDNTTFFSHMDDAKIVKLVVKFCPDMENLKVRVKDETMNLMHTLKNLKHLEVRFFTDRHTRVGPRTRIYLTCCGWQLSTFTIFCHTLESGFVVDIAENCPNLKKLFLHANLSRISQDSPLLASKNKLQNLEVLSLRLGDDELVMNTSGCDILTFLLEKAQCLQELYMLFRCPELNHDFIQSLLSVNPLSCVKNIIIDVPRRTMSAPMLEVTVETVYALMDSCKRLKLLGNLICWNMSQEEVAEIRATSKKRNYNLTIVCAKSNTLNTKYL